MVSYHVPYLDKARSKYIASSKKVEESSMMHHMPQTESEFEHNEREKRIKIFLQFIKLLVLQILKLQCFQGIPNKLIYKLI